MHIDYVEEGNGTLCDRYGFSFHKFTVLFTPACAYNSLSTKGRFDEALVDNVRIDNDSEPTEGFI